MKNKRNLLITLADENYIEQAKQLFSSVYWNAGWKGDYMLLSYKISEKELKWFRKKGILIKKCTFSSDLMPKRWPSVTLSKFYLFTPEFKKWKNIIYLDADIIVRTSLDDLTSVKGFAAARGHIKIFNLYLKPIHIWLDKRDGLKLKKLKKQYNLNTVGFNSGVMAFNSSIIKKDMFEKLIEFNTNYREVCATGDEPLLNLLFYKKWEKLPAFYNMQIDYVINHYNLKPEKIDGIIFHFVLKKPWVSKNHFYKEWKNSLEKAELIDLKKIQPAKKVWAKQEIDNYLKYLEKRRKRFLYKKYIWKFFQSIDRCIGLVGLFLKNNHPKLYRKLKTIRK